MERLRPDAAAAHRRNTRRLVDEIVAFANRARADAILCTGDLFDSVSPYRDTVESVCRSFAAAAMPVFITPGNHDPFLGASPYRTAAWSENVHIFSSETVETVELNGFSVSGFGFCSDQPALRPLEGVMTGTVFVGHGDLLTPSSDYAAFPAEDLRDCGASYAAIGHVHKPEARMLGPLLTVQNGSVEGRGYDETGERGFWEVDLVPGTAPTALLIPSGGSRAVRLDLTDLPGDTPTLAAEIALRCGRYPERTMVRVEAYADDPQGLTEALAGRYLDVKLVCRTRETGNDTPETELTRMVAARAAEALAHAKNERETLIAQRALRFAAAALERREQPRFESEAEI